MHSGANALYGWTNQVYYIYRYIPAYGPCGFHTKICKCQVHQSQFPQRQQDPRSYGLD